MSTTTVTGQQVARQLGSAVDSTFYAPLDFPPFIARTLDHVSPDLLILIDTEVWPNLLRACRQRGIKTVLVNGRMSGRSYHRYRLVRPFIRRFLENLDRVCVQTDRWGKRFVALGFPPERLTVTGSLKFDVLKTSETDSSLHAGDRAIPYFQFTFGKPVIIAASTLHGEEEMVLRAFAHIREVAKDAVLIVAPRHPERFEQVYKLVTAHGFEVIRRTALSLEKQPSECVIVLDTIGELPRLFQLATLVFVGGSLVPAGGHNFLEPAIFGKPIVFGPHMENFLDIAELFVERHAACQVDSANKLDETLLSLINDPVRCSGLGDAARALVKANRGGRARSLVVISDLLPPSSPDNDNDVRKIHVFS
jgi:3-deoxy-D-manno-octulosonic-acid transferase